MVASSSARRSAAAVARSGSPSTRSAPTVTPSSVDVRPARRLASSVVDGVDRRAALPGTTKPPTPVVAGGARRRRATTTSSSTASPSTTQRFVPRSTTPSPSGVAVAVDLAGVERAGRSAIASGAGELARGDGGEEPRLLRRASPASRTAGTNCVTVASSGPGAIDPAELLGEDRGSTMPRPMPPCSSGTVSAGQPSSTIVAHRRVGASASVLDDVAGERDRALARSTARIGVAQLVLVGGELAAP